MSDSMTLQGTVQKSQMGVGTWALLAGRTYEIYKAQPKEMLEDGKLVRVTGRIRDDVMTIAMIGPVFEVESFEEL
ncbi:MAG: hypothetical protein AAGA75_17715 [Cyanobacteria bacterium P01_E01_bin.6]